MDYAGVPFSGVPDAILGYNGNGGYAEEMYAADGTVSNGFNQHEGYQPEEDQEEYGNADGGDYRESRNIQVDGGDQYGVSTLAFDMKEELLWMGNQGGHVTSYFSANCMKYTSFQAHPTDEIRDLCAIDAGILALTPTSLIHRTRFGMPVFNYNNDAMENMQCLLNPIDYPQHVLIGGHQETLLEFDLNQQEVSRTYKIGENGCVILRDHQRFVCGGDISGKIILWDPNTLESQYEYQAHSGTLSDFDVQGNYIISCGFSNRMGRMYEDQFVMVYDMRMMKMSLPLRAIMPPYLIRFVPGMTSTLAAVSLIGHWQLMDAAQPDNAIMGLNYQVSCIPESTITSFAVSSSSQALAFGDNMGYLHLFTSTSKPTFNNYSQETVLGEPLEQTYSIPLNDITSSFGHIPLNIPQEPLASDWPKELMQVKYRPTPPIDPHILQSMKMVGPIGYAPNTKNLKRNVCPYKLNGSSKSQKPQASDQPSNKNEEGMTVHVPRRYRKIELKYSKMGMEDFDFDHYNRTSFSGLEMSLPNSYCNPMIQIFYYIAPLRAALKSHLCEREFCLACELGLLFHMLDISMCQGIPCHAANFLRAFRTIPEASAMGLTISDQDNRAKINFLSKIQSWNCFVLQQIHTETLKVNLDSHALQHEQIVGSISGIIGESLAIRSSDEMIGGKKQELNSVVSDILGASVANINRCTRCSHQIQSNVISLLLNLSYIETPTELAQSGTPFSTVVERSMCLEQTTQAWCECCKKYQPVEQFRRYKSLPNAIAMNCGLDSTQDVKYWKNQYEILLTGVQDKIKGKENASTDGSSSPTKEVTGTPTKKAENILTQPPHKVRPCRYGNLCVRGDCKFWHQGRTQGSNANAHILGLLDQSMQYSWIPLGLRGKINEDGTVAFKDIPKEEFDTAEDNEEGDVYELCGVISHISAPNYPDKNNLVACIKVGPSYHERANVSPVSHWYLFNDISIVPITAEEAVWFPCGWKYPCVLYWVRKNLPTNLDTLKEVNPITNDVFGEDKSLAQRGRKRITFSPLTADELPGEGDLVAMDAEFVNLHQEEAEIRSDGTRTTIKPSHKSVARITCIRGQGILEGTPFMDDYISTQEQVVDYLTQFSGIKPGDLDANYSQKHLTTLKSTYLKLRYLVDKGVKFVGHGLKNDFRVINMVVPQHQLIDTVHLFHMPHNRMISLKFLAWYFLNLKIQSITHDSIEDAKTALALYKKHEELQSMNLKVVEIQALYEAGKKAGWKVPGEDGLTGKSDLLDID